MANTHTENKRSFKGVQLLKRTVFITPYWVLGLYFVVLSSNAVTGTTSAEPEDGIHDETLYTHPLLTSSLDALGNRLDWSDESDLLRQVERYQAVVIDEDGSVDYDYGSRQRQLTYEQEIEQPNEPQYSGPTVDPRIVQIIYNPPADTNELVDISVTIRDDLWEEGLTVHDQLDRAMIRGEILTWGDARAFRKEVLDARKERGIEAIQEFIDHAVNVGAEVTWYSGLTASVRVRLPMSEVQELMEFEGLKAANIMATEETDAGYDYTVTGETVDGRELEDLIQSWQFYDREYYGDSTIGHEENSADSRADNVYRAHPGFKSGPFGYSRFFNCTWSDDTCSNPSPDPGDAHATAVASVLIGDITKGQDSSISSLGTARRKRSGVARGASVRGVAGLEAASEVFTTSPYIVDLLNMSAHMSGDPDCQGQDAYSITANAMYESGIAFFNAGGNNGHDDAVACTVKSPGSAIGVFKVNAFYVNSSDEEVIADVSSRGGTEGSEGRGRTIIDVTAPSLIEYPYAYSSELEDTAGDPLVYGTDWPGTSDPGPESFCCNSAATPVVTGAAEVFRDWFHDIYGSAIDDPGSLYVNMLLMGDGKQETSGRLSVGYSNLWGAGRLRLRAFDATGLSTTAQGWSTGVTCVDSGTTVSINIGSGSMGNTVHMVRGTAWWYDHRHDSSDPVVDNDRVTLSIGYQSGLTFNVVESDYGTDNKRRVFIDDPTTGYQYKMKLSGTNVTSDEEGCGDNSAKVYWAYFYEANNPPTGIRPEHPFTE